MRFHRYLHLGLHVKHGQSPVLNIYGLLLRVEVVLVNPAELTGELTGSELLVMDPYSLIQL